MEVWSDNPIDHFRIKFYLDTNILTYLVDKSYSGLSTTIDYFKNCAFTDLVSSNYVIFEFVGVRKREHYLREVITKNTSKGGDVNLNSLLKYKDDFDSPGVKFTDVKSSIEKQVNDELKEIVNNYGIIYENNLLHNKLLAPTFEINLNSRISKEDSLVLVSSLWPEESTIEPYIFLISNDKEFVRGYSETDLNEIFSKYHLQSPIVEQARAMQLNGKHYLNLTSDSEDHKLTQFLPEKVKELLIDKNKTLYLGKTIPCGKSANFPKDVICFKLNKNTELNIGLFVTIIGKDLDFIYTTRTKIDDFWDQTPIKNYPYINPENRDISFRPYEIDESGDLIKLPDNIISKLRETDNLVFINPDSFV